MSEETKPWIVCELIENVRVVSHEHPEDLRSEKGEVYVRVPDSPDFNEQLEAVKWIKEEGPEGMLVAVRRGKKFDVEMARKASEVL